MQRVQSQIDCELWPIFNNAEIFTTKKKQGARETAQWNENMTPVQTNR